MTGNATTATTATNIQVVLEEVFHIKPRNTTALLANGTVVKY
jgi:hypothetical protein